MSETPNDVIRRLRLSHPRSWFIKESGGILTHAKVSNLERGRKPSDAEVVVIMALPGATDENTQPQTPVQPPAPITPTVDTGETTPIEQAMVEWQQEDGPVSLKSLYEQLFEDKGLEPPVPQMLSEAPPTVVMNLPPVPTITTAASTRIEFIPPVEAVIDFFKPMQYVEATKPEISIKMDLGKISPTQLSVIDGVKRIGNSEVQTAKRCKRKWWLTYHRMLQLRKKDQLVGVRSVGDRVHRALQQAYAADASKRVDARVALNQVISDDWAEIVTQYNNDVPPEMKILFEKQNDLERAMVEGYVDWLAETGADNELEIVAPEAYLEAMLPELEVMIIGRLDVRVRRIYDGVRLFMDHKTVGDFGVVKTLPMDEQMLMYILLEELQQDTNPRVAGALYNMLRRVKRTATAKPPFYHRVEVRHSPIEIASFRRRLVSTLDGILKMGQALDAGAHHLDVVPPTPTKNCVWDCQFFGVCKMFDDGSRVEDAITAMYEVGDAYGYYAKGLTESEVTE